MMEFDRFNRLLQAHVATIFKSQSTLFVHHFRVDLPRKFINTSTKSEASVMAEYRDVKNVFARSLAEISRDAIETVLDLIAQNSLYKGEEWQGALEHFRNLHIVYHTGSPASMGKMG